MIPIASNNPTGQVGLGVYVSYQRREDGSIVRMWLGTQDSGPILQWDADGSDKWDGREHREFEDGAWTPLYSRGDYGRNVACGGHWSSHTNNLEGVKRKDKSWRGVMLPDNSLFEVPDGIQEDVTVTDIDCSVGWPVWFASGIEAVKARLTYEQACKASLPAQTKAAMQRETRDTIESVVDVLRAWSKEDAQ
jgi:hypothetical protein